MKHGFELISFGLEPLSQDTVVDGAIMDAPLVAGAISNIFDSHKVKTKNVATAVSWHSVIVKRVSLSMATEEELLRSHPIRGQSAHSQDIADVT